jgi:ABC-2 type transport system ATP-binding protein
MRVMEKVPAIRTEALTRTYRRSRKAKKANGAADSDLIALDGVSLEVREGELFGLLGPNGAGKTTLIKILTTLLAPTAGAAWVDGKDVVREAHAVRPLINVVSGGESCGYGVLNVRENLWLFTQIYGVSNADAKNRIEQMLDVVDLADKATTKVSHLSTGQRQKMNFCRGFITDPKVLFLDEPTLGLDVNAARSIRKFVRAWLAERPSRTLLLTTHYMMEADELCDRLAIIDRGKVLACDTPANLKRRVQEFPLFQIGVAPGPGSMKLDAVPGVHQATETAGPTAVDWKVSLAEEAVIGAVVQRIVESGSRILSLKKVEPTLEDVFIELVGHGLEASEAPA